MSWCSVGLTCFTVLCVVTVGVQTKDLRLGAFNIQVLGTSKMSETHVVEILVKIIRRYDLLLIQEIRDTSQTAVKNLLELTNTGEEEADIFSMTISGRLGRTSSKEQYAFFYREGAGLSVMDSYTFYDTEMVDVNGTLQEVDIFEREPYIVKFRSTTTLLGEFALIGIHVAPGEAEHEIRELEDVFYHSVTRLGVSAVMAMGDLNAGCRYVTKSEWKTITWRNDPKFDWLIGDDVDTTVKGTDCPYDRLITYGPGWATGVVPGSSVVYKFDQDVATLGEMNQTVAEDVSDHYPVEFKLKSRTGIVFIYRVYVLINELINQRLEKEVKYRVKPPTQADTPWNVYSLADPEFKLPVAKLRAEKPDEKLLLSNLKKITENTWYEDMSVIPTKGRYRSSQQVRMIIKVPLEHLPDVQNAVQSTCKTRSHDCLFEN